MVGGSRWESRTDGQSCENRHCLTSCYMLFGSISVLEWKWMLGQISWRMSLKDGSESLHVRLRFQRSPIRVERFRDVRFWIRGSTIVPGETEPTREMIRRFFKSVEKEEHLQHRQVVMLLHYRVGSLVRMTTLEMNYGDWLTPLDLNRRTRWSWRVIETFSVTLWMSSWQAELLNWRDWIFSYWGYRKYAQYKYVCNTISQERPWSLRVIADTGCINWKLELFH